jgi:hypothetical protein
LLGANVLTVLVALALTRLESLQRTGCQAILVAVVAVLVTGPVNDKPAVLLIGCYGGAYRGLGYAQLTGQVFLCGDTHTLVCAWVSERLTVGTLLGRPNNQVSYAGEDSFGSALVLVQVTVKHREIFFECHD